MHMHTSVGITASDNVGKVASKFLINPDCSTEVSLHYLDEVVFSVTNFNVGLEDKTLQIKTKQHMHGIAIRYFIFRAIWSVVKS
jgi:hypothetical protein